MPIDNCPYTFAELTKRVLPKQMAAMRRAMTRPEPMSLFDRTGIGPKAILDRLARSEDFPGCYVMMRGRSPVYVGISRVVVHRLIQHVKGRTHYDASLAYRMACERRPHGLGEHRGKGG